MEAGLRMKETGKANDLLKRMRDDEDFAGILEKDKHFLDPNAFIGRSPGQVTAYLDTVVEPLLEKRSGLIEENGEEISF
jgi:hypothetical protein